MNVGSRVTTPDGHTGTVKHFLIDYRWAFNHPNVITWAAVKLDDEDRMQMLIPSQLKEAIVNETAEDKGGLLIQAPENTTTTEEPDPTEPQPEPADGDDDNEQLIEFPE